MADIKTVLTELLKTITAEVNKPEIQQMSFKEFSTSEQLQFEHNLSALEARVQQIPAEIEQEQEQEQEHPYCSSLQRSNLALVSCHRYLFCAKPSQED